MVRDAFPNLGFVAIKSYCINPQLLHPQLLSSFQKITLFPFLQKIKSISCEKITIYDIFASKLQLLVCTKTAAIVKYMKNNGKYRILAIDDEPSVLRIIRHFFKEKFEVDGEDNAEAGIKRMQAGQLPDIIICDLNMPDINGMELLKMVRSSGFFSSIPVIMLSATESTEQKIEVLNAGADDFLVKPFNPKELEARINSILRRTGKDSFAF